MPKSTGLITSPSQFTHCGTLHLCDRNVLEISKPADFITSRKEKLSSEDIFFSSQFRKEKKRRTLIIVMSIQQSYISEKQGIGPIPIDI